MVTLLGRVRALSIRLGHGLDGSESLPSGIQSVLRVLGTGGAQNVPEIARATGTSRQNIQIVVNRLRRTGYVELANNPSHKRSPHIVLTNRGEALIKTYHQAEAGFLARVLEEVQEQDMVTASEVLKQLGHLLTPPSNVKEPLSDSRPFLPKRSFKPMPTPSAESSEEEPWTLPVNLL